jgi:hypothetical protein
VGKGREVYEESFGCATTSRAKKVRRVEWVTGGRDISSLVVLIRSKDKIFERERSERGFRIRFRFVCE